MNTKILYLLLASFTLVGCDWIGDLDSNDRYDEYEGKMIERIRIEQGSAQSDFIYYTYDRRGRITEIENTYDGTLERYSYLENEYGDEIIVMNSNLGDQREIVLDWGGYAESEVQYVGDEVAQVIEYDYSRYMLRDVYVEQYNTAGQVFSEEQYDFTYDQNDNLMEIEREYDEDKYYEDIDIIFTEYSKYLNDCNIDILSLLDLYIYNDKASHIGRTGVRSSLLPTKVKIVTKDSNSGSYTPVMFDIKYEGVNGSVDSIEIVSSQGVTKRFFISYL